MVRGSVCFDAGTESGNPAALLAMVAGSVIKLARRNLFRGRAPMCVVRPPEPSISTLVEVLFCYYCPMTDFLLHGGQLKIKNKNNDGNFQKLTQKLEDGDEVLFIGFARPNEKDRLEIFQRDSKLIKAQTSASIKVINATYENLISQISKVKAVHITGGEAPHLVKEISKYPDFINALSGKVVGGSSAGACLFSTVYFFNSELGILKGLATLPIKMMVHYGNPAYDATDESLKLLKNFDDNLELVVLKESEWVVR
jgi:peptidase E